MVILRNEGIESHCPPKGRLSQSFAGLRW